MTSSRIHARNAFRGMGIVSLCGILCLSAQGARGDEDWPARQLTQVSYFEDPACKSCLDDQDKKEEKHDYGPALCGNPRKTLMQWSYGTSFSGGPPDPNEPLESDRPGFTNSSNTVGRGVVQLESGYNFTLDRSGGVKTTQHDMPEMLWRAGVLADWLELRIQYNYTFQEIDSGLGPGRRSSGSDDLYLGFKLGLTPQEKLLPQMALLIDSTVPTGSSSRTAGEFLPGVGLCYSWDVNKWLGVSAETQIHRDRDDQQSTYSQFAQSLSLNYKLTKELQAFSEWYVIAPSGTTIARTQHSLDGGFTWHVTNNFQLDIEAGLGLSAAAPDFFTGAGLVARF